MCEWISGNFFYRVKNRETIAAIEENNDTHCLQKQIETFPLVGLRFTDVTLWVLANDKSVSKCENVLSTVVGPWRIHFTTESITPVPVHKP